MLIQRQGRLSTLLGHTPDGADSPQRSGSRHRAQRASKANGDGRPVSFRPATSNGDCRHERVQPQFQAKAFPDKQRRRTTLLQLQKVSRIPSNCRRCRESSSLHRHGSHQYYDLRRELGPQHCRWQWQYHTLAPGFEQFGCLPGRSNLDPADPADPADLADPARPWGRQCSTIAASRCSGTR
jgi:hypothetical protein